MNVQDYTKYIEGHYALPKGEASEDIVLYLSIYFNMYMIIVDELRILMHDGSDKDMSVYNDIIEIIKNDDFEIQKIVLHKISEYGLITATNVVDIDDMKVMYFLAQTIAERVLTVIPLEYIKSVTYIAYSYMKKQIDNIVPEDENFTCLMLDKIDYMYDNPNISIREMWDLFGKFGIYTLVKSLYLPYHRKYVGNNDV
ncbi:MAG: hypothetical protein Q9M36_09255 [Sulfurovum sp.]|nr:hypothetical protein [Sulfurovum sp.]